MALKATALAEMTQNNGHNAVQGHSRLPLSRTNRKPVCKVSIGENLAPFSTKRSAKFSATKLGLKKHRGKAHFDILNRLGVTHDCDRQTDRHSDSKCRVNPRCASKNVLLDFVYFGLNV